jgi:hypothetical protein
MQNGTKKDGIALAKARWAAVPFHFDLSDETWQQLAEQYRTGEILQAIKLMKGTADPRPERVYARFVQMIERISQRSDNQQY